MDPAMPVFVGVMAAIFVIGIVLRRLRQPHVTAYLVAGAVIGPFGIGLVDDVAVVARAGEFGVVLLLFFAGMEMQLPKLVAGWRVPVLGTALQITLSVSITLTLGHFLSWPVGRSVLLGFVISLSSTGVVMKFLRDRGEADMPVGTDAIGILLVQDVAVIAMLITVGLLGGSGVNAGALALQLGGGGLIAVLVVFLARRETITLPFRRWLKGDHELQIFSAFLLAFGFALLTAMAGLSAALGAFIAGLVVGSAKETTWVTEALHPFHVLFLALFFVSVGMLIDLDFLRENAGVIGGLVFAALIVNTAINAGAFRLLGLPWHRAIYGAALLAQIGEFSFVLTAVGKEAGLISPHGYQIALAVIAVSLFLSPFWIALGRLITTRHATGQSGG